MTMTRTYRAILSLALASLPFAAPAAQDPLTVSPDAYRLVFENDWVRVVRVHYGPREVIAPHEHTALAAAYVYLNDGGPILFTHVDLPYGAVTRPATRAGSFRVYRGLKEVHTVENPTDVPSEFLRVEFKTQPIDEGSLKGKFYREDHARGVNLQRVQFENAQIRITRLIAAPGQALEHAAAAGGPALLVALTESRVEVGRPGSGGDGAGLLTGETGWVSAGDRAWIRGGAESAAELLLFEFKTNPVRHGSEPMEVELVKAPGSWPPPDPRARLVAPAGSRPAEQPRSAARATPRK